jgi:predicted DNA-binding protein (MmcQ/YjbR family)
VSPDKLFHWVVKYLYPLKHIPMLPYIFDGILKMHAYFFHEELLDWLDDIDNEMVKLPEVVISSHKYGGVQYNALGKEIGHIHGNGLVDIRFTKKLKAQICEEGKVEEHHILKKTGWLSFQLKDSEDVAYAIKLLRQSHSLLLQRSNYKVPTNSKPISSTN